MIDLRQKWVAIFNEMHSENGNCSWLNLPAKIFTMQCMFVLFRTWSICLKSAVRTPERRYQNLVWRICSSVVPGDTLRRYFFVLYMSKQPSAKNFLLKIYFDTKLNVRSTSLAFYLMSFWWNISSLRSAFSTLIKCSYLGFTHPCT